MNQFNRQRLRGFKNSMRRFTEGTIYADKGEGSGVPPIDTGFYLFQNGQQFLFQDGTIYEFN